MRREVLLWWLVDGSNTAGWPAVHQPLTDSADTCGYSRLFAQASSCRLPRCNAASGKRTLFYPACPFVTVRRTALICAFQHTTISRGNRGQPPFAPLFTPRLLTDSPPPGTGFRSRRLARRT